MSTKERQRLQVIGRIHHRDTTVAAAAESLQISERQMYRLLRRHKKDGDKGIIHRLRGKTSNSGYALLVRSHVLKLYQERYSDYGPTLFSEMLSQSHHITIDSDTLRRWLKGAKLWNGARAARLHRQKRARREALGALLQFDGSFHDWFEGRGPECCLLVAIDDASGEVFLRFSSSENTTDVLRILQSYVQRYGIPQQFYTDHGSVYYNKHHCQTDVARALTSLGVELIYAHSPQAKGRVERSNRTHQDRLIKALRRRNISKIDDASRYLEETYINEHNQRFAHSNGLDDIHRSALGLDLKNIFCFETTRQLHNDSTITLKNTFIQLLRSNDPLPPPRTQITVRRWLDDSLHILWNDHELRYEILSNRPLCPKRQLPNPPPDHPWRWKLVGSVRAQKRLDKLFDRQPPKPYYSPQPQTQPIA
jgi:transposase InsO family protein